MSYRFRGHFRNQRVFQPTPDPQLRFRITQAIEDHHPEQAFGVELAPRAKNAPEGIGEAKILPQRRQHPRVADRKRRRKGDVAGAFVHRRSAGGPQQPVDQGVVLTGAHRLDSAEGGNDTLTRRAAAIAERFDQLDVLAPT